MKEKISKNICLIVFFLCCMGCNIEMPRKTLSTGPSASIESSKRNGAYVGSYSWCFIPYTDCDIDSVIKINEAFVEKGHHWFSYDSDSIVCIDDSYDFVVWCKSFNENVIFPNLVYGFYKKKKYLLEHELRSIHNIIDICDTISTHVVWAPDSHFDEFGRYEYSLREGFYDFNDVEAYKKYKSADGAVVLGLLQFVRNKD
ncbi:MAG: hypothetical protein E7077_02445 [Bacteroidales bacterium]|jgi:hypothetical protein|nr:hypothetical protein [Bacteroidales bacterium]